MFFHTQLISRIVLTVISASAFYLPTAASANSCSRADVDFYLQRGFTTDQVTRLCSTTVAPQAQYSAPVYAPANPQNLKMRDDQTFLSTALDARNVNLSKDGLTYTAEECAIKENHPIHRDLDEEVCIKSNVDIKFAGLKIIDSQQGFLMLRESNLVVQGDVSREYTNFNRIRRQDRSLVKELLPNKPNTLKIKARRGMDPQLIADRLRPYIL